VLDLLPLFSQAFLTLFVVMDPVGLAPIFLGIAGTRSSVERRLFARKSSFVAGGVILLFALAGRPLLNQLGISLAAFRASGGVLLFLIALDMVFARHSGARENSEEELEAQSRNDLSVFPIAIPLIAGPGTLASVMILTGKSQTLAGDAVIIFTAFIVLGLCYLSLRASSRLISLVGVTGVNVVSRVLGVLLAALAVQYIADGTRSLLGI
jgi:multiple antibiotic resistance protein